MCYHYKLKPCFLPNFKILGYREVAYRIGWVSLRASKYVVYMYYLLNVLTDLETWVFHTFKRTSTYVFGIDFASIPVHLFKKKSIERRIDREGNKVIL